MNSTVKTASKRSARQVTLRLPEPLYQSVKRVARARHTSINQLAQEQLEHLAKQEREAQLAAAYEELADDEETNVELFLAAQSEIVRREEKSFDG